MDSFSSKNELNRVLYYLYVWLIIKYSYYRNIYSIFLTIHGLNECLIQLFVPYSWRVSSTDNYHQARKSWWLSMLLQKWECRWSFTFTVLALHSATKDVMKFLSLSQTKQGTRYGFVKCKQCSTLSDIEKWWVSFYISVWVVITVPFILLILK